jgi:diguanylate cyclase (GGDEF)-like protein
MKRFSSLLTSWWYDTMTPTRGPMTTLAERETMRKRRLFSLVLFVSLLMTLSYVGYMSLTVFTSELFTCLLAISCELVALWLNRQGYLTVASLLFFLGTEALLLLGAQPASLSNPYILIWTCFVLTIFLTALGLFVPAWVILLLAILENLLLIWYLLVICHTQVASLFSPAELQNMLSFLVIMIYDSALVGIYYALTTKKAVLQADRAVEVEQAHQALSQTHDQLQRAHTQLETAYADLEEAHATIQRQALIDPLTGLPNHRAVLEQLGKELDRAERFERTACLLFLDLDHFKALNDGYGHQAGDEALCAFGQLMQQHVRSTDTVGRWGGEEFLVIFPETTLQEAQTIAERIREAVSHQTFAISGGLHLTCSIGLACFPSHFSTQEALITAADQAMYAAKRLGRNQVRCIDEAIVQTVLTGEESDRETTTLRGFIEALTSLVEQRDSALGDHSNEVADLVQQVALNVGVPAREAQMMRLAGQLHDIGKIGVPDAILQKPARLTEEEWHQMKEHAARGAEVVACIPALRPLSALIRAHHEWWDGAGYPDQLQQRAIPLGARIITVVDSYTAMIAERSYQRARSPEEAVAELRRCAGRQFDPLVVEALVEVLQDQQDQQQGVHAA